MFVIHRRSFKKTILKHTSLIPFNAKIKASEHDEVKFLTSNKTLIYPSHMKISFH